MEHGVSPTLRLWQLAESLRGYRERADLTIEEAGTQLQSFPGRWSRSKVQRIETRVYTPRAKEVEYLCSAYGVSAEETAVLVQMAAEARQRGWWQSSAIPKPNQILVGLEQSTTTIRQFELALVPGLLQTSDYARALVAAIQPTTPIEIAESTVAARMIRQHVLRREHPAEYHVVLSETVLRTLVGDKRVMRGQLERLLDAAGQANVTVQIVPFDYGAHVGMEGSFTLLTVPAMASDVVYTEGPAGTIYLESQDNVRDCTMRFAALTAKALTPAASLDLIGTILTEYR